jgi:hypothetical protein
MGWAAVVAALLGLTSCATIGLGRPGSVPTPSAWQQVMAGIRPDGTVPLQTALQAFSLAVAPLPGVAMPSGARDQIFTGGGAVRWVFGHWSELTPTQRAAVRAALPGPDAPRASAGPGARLLACDAAAGADSPGTGPYRALVDQALAYIGAHLGPLASPTFVVLGGLQVNGSLAEAEPIDCDKAEVGPEASCVIHIGRIGGGAGGPELRATMTHEVFHCFQAQLMGSVGAWVNLKAAPWMMEGSAEWVGEEAAPGSTVSAKWWPDYLTKPGRSLFERSYDAIGFYAHLQESYIDPWSRFQSTFTASSNAAAYARATAPAAGAFLDSWAAGYARRPTWGSGWDTTGPNITADRPAVERLLIGNNGGPSQPAALAYANYVGEFDLQADVVMVDVTGHGRLRTSDGRTLMPSGGLDGAYCLLSGGCTCPPHSACVGPPLRAASRGVAFLALSGGPDGSSASVEGRSLDTFCSEPPSPTPTTSPSGTQGSCGTYVRSSEAPTSLDSVQLLTSPQGGGYSETLCHYYYGTLAVIVFNSRAGAQDGYQAATSQCANIGRPSAAAFGGDASFEMTGAARSDQTAAVCAVALKGVAVVAADYNEEDVSVGQVEALMRLVVSRIR